MQCNLLQVRVLDPNRDLPDPAPTLEKKTDPDSLAALCSAVCEANTNEAVSDVFKCTNLFSRIYDGE